MGGTAAVGFVGGVALGQAGDGEAGRSREDYWWVTEDEATAVAEDTDEVQADGDVVIGRGVVVDGPVQAGGHVLVGEGTVVTGAIDAGGAVVTDFVVDVDGGISAGDDVVLGVDIVPTQQANAAGDLERVGDLPMEGGVLVGDDVTTSGDVLIGPDGVVEGSVSAGNEAESGTEGDEGADGAGGDGESEGGEQPGPPSVVLGSWVDVEDDLVAAGDVALGPDSYVGGTVTAGGTVVFTDGATFGGIEADRIDEGPEADVWPEEEPPQEGGEEAEATGTDGGDDGAGQA